MDIGSGSKFKQTLLNIL